MRIARGISVTNTSKPISTAIAYDADATAFFTAASITDTTQKSAINQLVLDLKSANIWTKIKALYPVVGGSASSHAVNLKQPGTFNLSFATGWTHSNTGMTPNGATYANTSCTTANMLLNSAHHSFYSRTDQAAVNSYEMGIYQTTPNCNTSLSLKNNTSNFTGKINNSGTTTTNISNTNSTGFYITSRTASNLTKNFKNQNLLQSHNNLSGAVSTNPYYIGANNNLGSAGLFSSKECAFSSIGDGLTDAEALSFYNAVQTYQTTLGRQV